MYDWIIQNKGLLKIIYALAITLICAIIVMKTHRLFRLSFHQGIRYFRNAFLFFGLGFFIRYFLDPFFPQYHLVAKILFEFFLVMAGFFLLYSLLWKKLESSKKNYSSSLWNKNIFIFYLMAFIIVVLDLIWNKYIFMFLSQFIIFSIASLVSYNNYIQKGRQRKFLKFYFLAMVLSLITWLLNFVLVMWMNWNQSILMNIYGLNIIVFLLFLFGVIKITNSK